MILFYSENRRGNPQGELYLTELFIVCNEQIYDRRLYDRITSKYLNFYMSRLQTLRCYVLHLEYN